MSDLADRLRSFVDAGAAPITLDEITSRRRLQPTAGDGPRRRRRDARAWSRRRAVAAVAVTLVVAAVVATLVVRRGAPSPAVHLPAGHRPQVQTITRFPIPAANQDPTAVTRGPDGNIWFTTTRAAVDRVTPDGQVTEIPIPGAAYGTGIAPRPDGDLWIADLGGRIERINPHHPTQVTNFPLANGQRAHDITAGPDGNLWFTEYIQPADPRATDFGARIGRITPAGVITEFAVPVEPSQPNAITTGPDGALWFTDSVGRVGRISTSGQIQLYGFPGAQRGGVTSQFGLEPQGGDGITTGPDHNIWFSTRTAIDRITPNGAISEFPLPANTSPKDMTLADGVIWFGSDSQVLGSITTSGTVNVYPLAPIDHVAFTLTAGAPGTLWISGYDHVLRVDLSGHARPSRPSTTLTLPKPTGPPPTDQRGARQAIDAAFQAVFDDPANVDRSGVLNGPQALIETGRQLLQARYGPPNMSLKVRITAFRFLNTTTAVLTFDLLSHGRPITPRWRWASNSNLGESHLINGRWTVERSTYCEAISRLDVECQPPPQPPRNGP